MNFFERLDLLCKENNTRISTVLTNLNKPVGLVSNWKKRGTIPNGDILTVFADYFNVSVDYLLGRSDDTPQTTPNELPPNYDKLNETGKQKVNEYINDLLENPKYTAINESK